MSSSGFVQLNRRFHKWERDGDESDSDWSRALGIEDRELGWAELLQERCVVVLAEAGCGKTAELKERERVAVREDKCAFYSTVSDVGREGLSRALEPEAQERYERWRRSDEDAWFFIDSADEARTIGVGLDQFLRRFVEGVGVGRQNWHLILSCRQTDWEYRADLERLNTQLGFRQPEARPAATEMGPLRRMVQSRSGSGGSADSQPRPLVVLVASLDRERVRLYCGARQVPEVDKFLEAIEGGDLWMFARRPLDLDWMVSHWREDRRLGSLEQMVELSVQKRLAETNPGRRREDGLAADRTNKAIERVGAAMVFGRKWTVEVDDGSGRGGRTGECLELAKVLSDWPPQDLGRLLQRPVFDPATFGRVRLHNDNDGTVRSYLAARWLLRLRGANLGTKRLLELLFAESYGYQVVRPSMRATVAWMALRDSDVARRTIQCCPELLLQKGDPGSLKLEWRRQVLTAVVEELALEETEARWWGWEGDGLRHFSQKDLEPDVLSLLERFGDRREARHLLLRIAWLARMDGCGSVGNQIARDPEMDETSRVWGGRVFLANGDKVELGSYGEFIRRQTGDAPGWMLLDAIEALFPEYLSVGDLLKMLGDLSADEEDCRRWSRWGGASLIGKLGNRRSDLERLLQGMLALVGGEAGGSNYHLLTARERFFLPTIAEAATQLLMNGRGDETLAAAIDAVLRIGDRPGIERDHQKSTEALYAELHRTSGRRERAFWYAAERLRAACSDPTEIDCIWDLKRSGYRPGLLLDDIGWLLGGLRERDEPDRRLAIDAACSIWRENGCPCDLLNRIREAAEVDDATREAFSVAQRRHAAVARPEDLDPTIRQYRELEVASQRRNEEGWQRFIAELRADPLRIDALKRPGDDCISADFMKLWNLIKAARRQDQFTLSDVSILEEAAGAEIASAVREGLVGSWRTNRPRIRSRLVAAERQKWCLGDMMALAGIGLESAAGVGWVGRLTEAEARVAAAHATLELTSYPVWLYDLVQVWPDQVREVMVAEIQAELEDPEGGRAETAQRILWERSELLELVGLAVLELLESREARNVEALLPALQVVARGVGEAGAERLVKLGRERFRQFREQPAGVQYLAAAWQHAPSEAVADLAEHLNGLDDAFAGRLLDRFLALAFDDSSSSALFTPNHIPVETLELLLNAIYRTGAGSDKTKEPATWGWVGPSEGAAQARGAVFGQLRRTSGAAAFAALRRLGEHPGCPISKGRMAQILKEKAILDSEDKAWRPEEVQKLEQEFERSPSTSRELQRLLISRIEDLQDDLSNGDFSEAEALRRCGNEAQVQNWIAARLKSGRGRAYDVVREPEQHGHKKPDIVAVTTESHAHVAIEIKIAERWTVGALEAALGVQLCGQYLRAAGQRHGVLLLVQKEARPRGWKGPKGMLDFAGVVQYLKLRALELAGAGSEAPQPEVCAISAVAGESEKARSGKGRRRKRRS